jgi:5,5'-dehydrodivanillate O-demethylase oxygenase subunit
MSVTDLRPRAARPKLGLHCTGPDTAGGRFMRQFWMPVMRVEDLPKGQAKPIRVMSEDFAVYRGARMHIGWVEGDDIRRLYHGWKFDCA